MVDQELDALLVGALYGELGPADEARLAAHLESHPTDRTALDDLRSTRKALVDARFFELWFDPPPAVSALLVQEAARRAPRSEATVGDSWFARFTRSFMSHPAMAAAAMLVVVVSVAGTLYMKKGDLAAPSPTVRETATSAVAEGSASAAAQTAVNGYAYDTPSTASYAGPTGTTTAAGNTKIVDGISADVDDKRLAFDRGRDQQAVAKAPTAEHAIKQGIEVAPKRFEPKDLEKADSGALADNDPAQQPAKEQQGYKGKAAPPPAPTSTPQTAMATVGASSGAGGDAANDQKSDPWAGEQHERVKSLVARGRCTDAANAAAEIQARSPDYYATNIANDRALKQCASYIANAVEKQEETRAKAASMKASKAAPAATDSK
jgi:hypothetical protein